MTAGTGTDEGRERRRRSFEQTAEAYDRHRPGYPDALFEGIRAYADLAVTDDRILEIGCGTGRATEHLAAWPQPLLAIEPAPAMADLARRRFAGHDNVEILTVMFEDWIVEPNAFGLVVCAQAYHWLDPATRNARIAAALYAHGTVAIVANVQVTPSEHLPFFTRVQDAYHAHAPELAHVGPFHGPHDLPEHALTGDPLFEDQHRLVHRWEWTLDAESYIALMATHSPHAALPPEQRSRLHDAIARLIDDEFEGSVTETYASIADLARKA